MKIINAIKNKLNLSQEVVPIGSNVLITNHCNQNCSFCFASELMTKDRTREMSLTNFELLLDYLDRNGSKKVFLMGGEPTLHSQFKEMVEMAAKRGFEIELFTNGQFSDDIAEFLKGMGSKIQMYHINIASPAYRVPVTHNKINKFIEEVSVYSMVALETTIGSLDSKIIFEVFKLAEEVLDKSYVRIGVDGGLVTRGGFSVQKNREIGRTIMDLKSMLFDKGIKGLWLAETNPCMFEDKDLVSMEKDERIKWKGFGCFSKNGGVDIKTDLKVIRCFGQDSLNGHPLQKANSLTAIKQTLDKEMMTKSQKTLPPECRTCKYHGYQEGNCPGPCLIGR